jgi:hypothetical protein
LLKVNATSRSPRKRLSHSLVLSAFLFLFTPLAYAEEFTGMVVGVTDGDTITVLTGVGGGRST